MRNRVAAEYRSTLDNLADQMTEPDNEPTATGPPRQPDSAQRRTRSPVATPLKRSQRGPRPATRAAPPRAERARPACAPATTPAVQEIAPAALGWSTGLLAVLLVFTLLTLVVVRHSVPSSANTQRATGWVEATLAETVLQVRDRWPSMFVTVDAEAWEEMSETGRLDLVRNLAGQLGTKRYEGALITAPDGRPVAQWLRGGGASLLDEVSESRTLTAQSETPVR
jgi:hypothetical protein